MLQANKGLFCPCGKSKKKGAETVGAADESGIQANSGETVALVLKTDFEKLLKKRFIDYDPNHWRWCYVPTKGIVVTASALTSMGLYVKLATDFIKHHAGTNNLLWQIAAVGSGSGTNFGLTFYVVDALIDKLLDRSQYRGPRDVILTGVLVVLGGVSAIPLGMAAKEGDGSPSVIEWINIGASLFVNFAIHAFIFNNLAREQGASLYRFINERHFYTPLQKEWLRIQNELVELLEEFIIHIVRHPVSIKSEFLGSTIAESEFKAALFKDMHAWFKKRQKNQQGGMGRFKNSQFVADSDWFLEKMFTVAGGLLGLVSVSGYPLNLFGRVVRTIHNPAASVGLNSLLVVPDIILLYFATVFASRTGDGVYKLLKRKFEIGHIAHVVPWLAIVGSLFSLSVTALSFSASLFLTETSKLFDILPSYLKTSVTLMTIIGAVIVNLYGFNSALDNKVLKNWVRLSLGGRDQKDRQRFAEKGASLIEGVKEFTPHQFSQHVHGDGDLSDLIHKVGLFTSKEQSWRIPVEVEVDQQLPREIKEAPSRCCGVCTMM